MNTDLQNNNFIVVKQFIPPAEAEELAVVFENDAKLKGFTGDSQIPNSLARYNYRHFLHLLCEKTKEMTILYGSKVVPTYCYSRVYLKGANLIPHTDREACEVSVTLCLSKCKDWPIFIRKPDGTPVSIELSAGDALIYRGCIAEHWREPYEGAKHVQVFLHYVDLAGPNLQHYFDRVRPHNYETTN